MILLNETRFLVTSEALKQFLGEILMQILHFLFIIVHACVLLSFDVANFK